MHVLSVFAYLIIKCLQNSNEVHRFCKQTTDPYYIIFLMHNISFAQCFSFSFMNLTRAERIHRNVLDFIFHDICVFHYIVDTFSQFICILCKFSTVRQCCSEGGALETRKYTPGKICMYKLHYVMNKCFPFCTVCFTAYKRFCWIQPMERSASFWVFCEISRSSETRRARHQISPASAIIFWCVWCTVVLLLHRYISVHFSHPIASAASSIWICMAHRFQCLIVI